MGVLTQVGRQVGMNKNISEWKTKVNGFGKTFTRSVKLTFTKSVKPIYRISQTQRQYTKDNKYKYPLTPKGDAMKVLNLKSENLPRLTTANILLPTTRLLVTDSHMQWRSILNDNAS